MTSPQRTEFKEFIEMLDPRTTKASVDSIVEALNSCYALKGHLINQLNMEAVSPDEFCNMSQTEQLGLYNKSRKLLDNSPLTQAISNLEVVLDSLEKQFSDQSSDPS